MACARGSAVAIGGRSRCTSKPRLLILAFTPGSLVSDGQASGAHGARWIEDLARLSASLMGL
jgi:hypothetical protein